MNPVMSKAVTVSPACPLHGQYDDDLRQVLEHGMRARPHLQEREACSATRCAASLSGHRCASGGIYVACLIAAVARVHV